LRQANGSRARLTTCSHTPTDLPGGLSCDFPVQPFTQKYSASRLTQIKSISVAVPAHRGAFRDRHERWAGDAVDAAARETGEFAAYGEVVWSRRLWVGVKLAEAIPPATVTSKS
jgi:hypothetical protein